MKKYALIFLVVLSGCTSGNDFEKGKKQLEAMGYTDIKRDGYTPFCCGDDDDFSTGWKAKNKAGEEVKGCMCSAWLKGVTIRYK